MKSSLEAVLEQYEKNKSEGKASENSKPRITSDERLKKYFSPNLDIKKGEEEGEETIRILPNPEGGSPFAEVWYHEIQVGGKWVKLYDPTQNDKFPDEASPLTDVYKALKADGTEKSKELAKKYRAKKFYIVKVIDRANEADGPKFYRFKHNWKNQGVFDKLIAIFRKKGEIWDPVNGRDVTLNLVKATTNNITYYTEVATILPEDASPLHADEATAQAWLNDATTWKDVYGKKPIEYLQGVAQGYEPVWDKELKKYVWGDPETGEAELSAGTDAADFLEADVQDIADDDLPF